MTSIIRVLKKFTSILSRHQKFRLFELSILMLIGGFLEMCSVSLVLPFMNAILKQNEVLNKWYVKMFCQIFSINSASNFLIVIAIMLATLYILKNIYLLFEFNVQYRFVYRNMFAMQNRLLENYINRPYEYFLEINSGEVVRIVNSDTPITFALLSTLISLFTELVVSGMLIIAIFIIAPIVTICMTVILIALMIIINTLIKPILREAGKKTQYGQAIMNKWLLQSIHGIKEIKVMGKQKYFCNNYNHYGNIYVDSMRQSYILNILPRFMIEAVSMSSFFLAIAIMIYIKLPLTTLIPMLSTVAMAALRLLPSINRISSAMASIAYNETMLDTLIENLTNINNGHASLAAYELGADTNIKSDIKLDFNQTIEFVNISYHYPHTEYQVLDNANLLIKKGEAIGIVGSSGSGKSTAIDILLGLLKPQNGHIFIDGKDVNDNLQGWLRIIGYIPQSIFMLDGSIKSNVAFGIAESKINEYDVIRALEEASLMDFINTLPDGLNTAIGEQGIRLSGGQRQRIGIARVLYTNPEILIFDEATSALDSDTEATIMEAINRLRGKKTLIMIAHRISTLKSCDRILRIVDGKIVLDTLLSPTLDNSN